MNIWSIFLYLELPANGVSPHIMYTISKVWNFNISNISLLTLWKFKHKLLSLSPFIYLLSMTTQT